MNPYKSSQNHKRRRLIIIFLSILITFIVLLILWISPWQQESFGRILYGVDETDIFGRRMTVDTQETDEVGRYIKKSIEPEETLETRSLIQSPDKTQEAGNLLSLEASEKASKAWASYKSLGETQPKEVQVVNITENIFVLLSNDIYYNPQDYMGKQIHYEGLYKESENPYNGEKHNFVIRYGPGCCAFDATCGFEIRYEGEKPKVDDWCELTGILETYEKGNNKILRIKVTELKVKEQRGVEYVYH